MGISLRTPSSASTFHTFVLVTLLPKLGWPSFTLSHPNFLASAEGVSCVGSELWGQRQRHRSRCATAALPPHDTQSRTTTEPTKPNPLCRALALDLDRASSAFPHSAGAALHRVTFDVRGCGVLPILKPPTGKLALSPQRPTCQTHTRTSLACSPQQCEKELSARSGSARNAFMLCVTLSVGSTRRCGR